jgi:hypothetical protein
MQTRVRSISYKFSNYLRPFLVLYALVESTLSFRTRIGVEDMHILQSVTYDSEDSNGVVTCSPTVWKHRQRAHPCMQLLDPSRFPSWLITCSLKAVEDRDCGEGYNVARTSRSNFFSVGDFLQLPTLVSPLSIILSFPIEGLHRHTC